MGAEDTLRDTLNTSNPNRLADALNVLEFGELLNLLLSGLTATETGVSATSSVATLANQPSALVLINATTATTTGVKKLRKGPITGPNAIVPATGEAVWDGGKKVLFATVDAVTVAAFTYATAANVSRSNLQQVLDK